MVGQEARDRVGVAQGGHRVRRLGQVAGALQPTGSASDQVVLVSAEAASLARA